MNANHGSPDTLMGKYEESVRIANDPEAWEKHRAWVARIEAALDKDAAEYNEELFNSAFDEDEDED